LPQQEKGPVQLGGSQPKIRKREGSRGGTATKNDHASQKDKTSKFSSHKAQRGRCEAGTLEI